jgi:hypothetical protein
VKRRTSRPATWKCHEEPVSSLADVISIRSGRGGLDIQPLALFLSLSLSLPRRAGNESGYPFCVFLFSIPISLKSEEPLASPCFVGSMVHWPRSCAREQTPVGPLKYHVSHSRKKREKKSRRIHTQIGTRRKARKAFGEISSLSLVRESCERAALLGIVR